MVEKRRGEDFGRDKIRSPSRMRNVDCGESLRHAGAGRRGRQPRDGWGCWHARRRPNQRWNVGGAAASEHFQASGVRITARREVGCRHDGAPQLELLAAREDVALVAG